MGLFDSILHKIFHAGTTTAPSNTGSTGVETSSPQAGSGAPAPAAPAPTASGSGQAPSAPEVGKPEAGTVSAPAVAPAQPVDVVAVLTQIAAQKGDGGHWQSSIVDLLKLLDLDSSLSARKQLAQELGMHAGADGSAEENIALHKAVMQKLAENGGKVPDNLKA